MAAILHIPIKKEWFDMIKSGVKRDEYREIKDFWVRRLVCFKDDLESMDEFICDLCSPGKRHENVEDLLRYFGAEFKHFDIVEFRNGYGKCVPFFQAKLNKVMVSTGRPAWGADPFKFYFVLKLGEIIKTGRRG